jgi:hypothetical protein
MAKEGSRLRGDRVLSLLSFYVQIPAVPAALDAMCGRNAGTLSILRPYRYGALTFTASFMRSQQPLFKH